jgi:hypothetical protein
MANSRKELLMPTTQQNPATALMKIEPEALVFNAKTESPAIIPDKTVKEPLNKTYNNVAIFFQQRISYFKNQQKSQTEGRSRQPQMLQEGQQPRRLIL